MNNEDKKAANKSLFDRLVRAMATGKPLSDKAETKPEKQAKPKKGSQARTRKQKVEK